MALPIVENTELGSDMREAFLRAGFGELVDPLFQSALPAWTPILEDFGVFSGNEQALIEELQCSHFDSKAAVVPIDFEMEDGPYAQGPLVSLRLSDLPETLRAKLGVNGDGMIVLTHSLDDFGRAVFFEFNDPNLQLKIVYATDDENSFVMKKVVGWQTELVPPNVCALGMDASSIPGFEVLSQMEPQRRNEFFDMTCEAGFESKSFLGGHPWLLQCDEPLLCEQCGGDTICVLHLDTNVLQRGQFSDSGVCNVGFCPICKLPTVNGDCC